MIRTLAAALTLAGLAACASVTPYQPAGDGYGFVEQKIEDARYRVAFKGNTSTKRETVENHLLYRMSEITLTEGYDYFRVLDQDTECHTNYVELGAQPCFRYRPHRSRFPYYAYGYECTSPTRIYETKEYEAVAFITLHYGTKPRDDPAAFDARAVSENLAGQISRSGIS